MVPAFGFSVTDFVSAIGLTVKIIKALKETGGASAECRMVIQDLQNLQQILELLQDLRPAGSSISHVNAIRGVTITCLIPLRDFAEKINRSYGPIANGSTSSGHFLRQGGKKAVWATFATEEVAKFRFIIAAKVASIGLLLGIFNNESLSRIENQNRESHGYLLAKSTEHKDALEMSLSGLAMSHHQDLSKGLHEACNDLKDTIVKIEEQTISRHNCLLGEANNHANKLEGLSRRIYQVQKEAHSNTKNRISLCFGTAAGTERMFQASQEDCRKAGEEVKSTREEQKQIGSQMLDKFHAAIQQVRVIRWIGASIFGCLIPFSEKVLRYLQENMKANMEIYALLLQVQSTMPKQLGDGDTIHFEDVLGRTKALPYEYFRHWEVFESMLRCEFRGFPGEVKVSRGQYILFNGTSTKDYIDRENWQQMVFPATKVKMSVIIENLGAASGSCPRPNCNGKMYVAEDWTVYHCPICKLDFVPQWPSNTAGHIHDLSLESVSKREPLKALRSQKAMLIDEGCIR